MYFCVLCFALTAIFLNQTRVWSRVAMRITSLQETNLPPEGWVFSGCLFAKEWLCLHFVLLVPASEKHPNLNLNSTEHMSEPGSLDNRGSVFFSRLTVFDRTSQSGTWEKAPKKNPTYCWTWGCCTETWIQTMLPTRNVCHVCYCRWSILRSATVNEVSKVQDLHSWTKLGEDSQVIWTHILSDHISKCYVTRSYSKHALGWDPNSWIWHHHWIIYFWICSAFIIIKSEWTHIITYIYICIWIYRYESYTDVLVEITAAIVALVDYLYFQNKGYLGSRCACR